MLVHRVPALVLVALLPFAGVGPSAGAPAERPDGAVRVTDPPPGASDQNPAFAPDGARLLFTRFEEGYNDGPAGLFLLDPATGAVDRLTPRADRDDVNLPGAAWNAAADRIAFASDREETDEVWTIAADGGDPIRVTHGTMGGPSREPSFAPDGEWIVFEAHSPESEEQGSIWKARRDGTGLTRLTDGPGGGTDDRQPNWSPRGDRILFQRRAAGGDDWDLYVVAPDGHDVAAVTPGPAGDTDASWSPDGAWIVYSSDAGGSEEPSLFLVPGAGGEPARLTCAPGRSDGAPSWSPDGATIAFESYPGVDDRPAALWQIALPARAPAGGLQPNAACPAD
jgi:TolB protein